MSNKSSYYSGSMRLMRDGVPCKVASWVADLSERSRKDFMGAKATEAVRIQGTMVRYPQTTYIPKDEPLQSFNIAAE